MIGACSLLSARIATCDVFVAQGAILAGSGGLDGHLAKVELSHRLRQRWLAGSARCTKCSSGYPSNPQWANAGNRQQRTHKTLPANRHA